MPITPIAPQCVATEPTSLVMKEKKLSFTGDGGSIKDTAGNKVFKIDAKKMTISERRELLDASGNAVGQMRKKKAPSLHKTIYIGTMDDEKKCTIKATGLLNPTNSDAKVFVGDEEVGKVSGNWRAKSYKIEINGEQVAEASRKTSFSSVLLDSDSYAIDIQPGNDMAFIVLLVIAMDEMYHDES